MAETAGIAEEKALEKKAKNVICYSIRKRLDKYYWRNGWNYTTRQISKKKLDLKYSF
jgi:hypothetical protein